MADELLLSLRKDWRTIADEITPGFSNSLPPLTTQARRSDYVRPPGIAMNRAAPMIMSQQYFQGRDLWQPAMKYEDKTTEILAQAWALHEKVVQPRPDWDESERMIRGLKTALKPHQNSGIAMIQHLEQKFEGTLLADEMGLGKTLLILAHIREQRDNKIITEPTLIIVDKILLPGWKKEIRESFSDMIHNLGTILNSPDEHDCSDYGFADLHELEVVLTTYDTVRMDYERILRYEQYIQHKVFREVEDEPPEEVKRPSSTLYGYSWGRIVADEAQKLRGTKVNSKISQAVRSPRWRGDKRLFVTGTPYMNYISDIAAVFAFLRIEPFSTPSVFRELFCKNDNAPERTLEGDPKQIMHKMLQISIQAIMIRRQATDHIKLPSLTRRTIEVTLDDEKQIDYWGNRTRQPFDPRTEYETQDQIRHFVNKTLPQYEPAVGENLRSSHLRARQSSTHWATHRAYLPDSPNTLDPAWLAEMQRDNNWRSTKIGALIDGIKSHLATPLVKVLVFDSFIPNVKLICFGLQANNIEYVEIHSKRTDKDRNRDIDRFRETHGPRVLVATEKSLNAGVNLQRASIIYLMTPSYTPDVERQCIGRAHRMGQERDVTVYRVLAKESMDDRVKQNFQKHKTRQGRRLMNTTQTRSDQFIDGQLRDMDEKRFCKMMRNGYRDLFSAEVDDRELDDADFKEDREEEDSWNEYEELHPMYEQADGIEWDEL